MRGSRCARRRRTRSPSSSRAPSGRIVHVLRMLSMVVFVARPRGAIGNVFRGRGGAPLAVAPRAKRGDAAGQRGGAARDAVISPPRRHLFFSLAMGTTTVARRRPLPSVAHATRIAGTRTDRRVVVDAQTRVLLACGRRHGSRALQRMVRTKGDAADAHGPHVPRRSRRV